MAIVWEPLRVEREVARAGRLLARPDDAVAELFHAHFRTMVGLASLLVDSRGEAEEIVQEAFVRLYASWNKMRDPQRAVGYLRTTVLNLSRSRLRRRRVARRYAADHADVDVLASPAADDVHVAPDARAAVVAAVEALPARQRDCVLLRYYAGCDEHEVASALGISAGSVKTHVHRAMATLASKLEPFS